MKYFFIFLTMLVAFLSLVGVIIVSKVFGFSSENFHDPSMVFDPLTVVVTLSILIIPILIVLMSQKFLLKRPLKTIGLKNSGYGSLLTGAAIGIFLKLITTSAAYIYSPNPSISFAVSDVSFTAWVPYFLWFVIALALNSLNEELAYRSFPLGNTIKQGYSDHIMVWLFAAFFSAMHFILEPPDLGSFFYRLSFGIVAGLLYTRTRSLWLIVGLHTGWNFIALSFTNSNWRIGNLVKLDGLTEGSMAWSNVLVLVLVYLGLCFSGRRFFNSESN